MVWSLVLVPGNGQQLPSSAAVGTEQSWHWGNGFCPIVPTQLDLVPTFCYYFVPAFTALLYSFCWRPWMPSSLRLAWCHLCLWSLPWGDAIAKTFKASEMFCSPYGGSCLQMYVLCWLGSMPSFSPCPCRPWKDAITELLATVAWAPLLGFVQANQRWLAANPQRWVSLSSSKTVPWRLFWSLRVCHDCRLARCPLAGTEWLAQRERKIGKWIERWISANVFLLNGHHGVTPYSFIVSSISLFNILLCFPSSI